MLNKLTGKDTFNQKELDKIEALKLSNPYFEVVIN